MQIHDDREAVQVSPDELPVIDIHNSQPLTSDGHVLRRRQKNATEAGAARFEKPAPDARDETREAHESIISRKTGAEVPLTGLSLGMERRAPRGRLRAG
ncbi:MAG: hypothetical protein ACKOES_14545 [Planctomycetaceae bacterium]